MFDLKSFIKNGLVDMVGKEPDYKVVNLSVSYLDKGILTETDLAEIDEKITGVPVAVTPDGSEPKEVEDGI